MFNDEIATLVLGIALGIAIAAVGVGAAIGVMCITKDIRKILKH